MLFSNQRKHQISIPMKDEDGSAADVAFLIRYLCRHVMKDNRRELFVTNERMYG